VFVRSVFVYCTQGELTQKLRDTGDHTHTHARTHARTHTHTQTHTFVDTIYTYNKAHALQKIPL